MSLSDSPAYEPRVALLQAWLQRTALSGFDGSRVSGLGLIDWQSYEENNASSGSSSPTYG